MKATSYTRINNLTGFIIFCIAAVVYCLTIEPTASFWDCGEFIVSAYKLEVGHPPGAPFFMLTANVFTQFTNDPELAARMINCMSALMSAATIWLLYLSITHLTRKLMWKSRQKGSRAEMIVIIASGVVGALAYAFSDTFWFSAVEGEVYAYSSLFTALVFWLILKWEEADDEYSDRWLILIAYLTGLSIGVHLLNLLCLPAIVLVYYYKKHPEVTVKGTMLALMVSAILIVVILYGLVPGIAKVGGWFELFFVNQVGLPFHSGLAVYLVLLAASMILGIYASQQRKNPAMSRAMLLLTIAMLGIPFYGYSTTAIVAGFVVLGAMFFYLFSQKVPARYKPTARVINTGLLCVMMIVIGYSSYAIIMIRSAANTPMDQNSPEDIFTLEYFLARTQYGQRPLFYGHSFLSEPALKVVKDGWMYDYEKGKTLYRQKVKDSEDEKDSYVDSGNLWEKRYAQNMLFPRMYSADHADNYRQWVDIKGKSVAYDRAGEIINVTVPTQWENLKFFIGYQMNFMYWRYFLWNFVGRQNDIQGNGELEHGNCITGFPFIDKLIEGDSNLMPAELKENKGRNVYFGLPLLLGIIGLLWQLRQGRQGQASGFIVFMLFFMTGLAIILYLNQTPVQVRERDYAYAGSFYAFAIWIGMGVAGVATLIRQKLKKKMPSAVIASAVCMLVPIQMVSQTWDDHDRSGRYSCRAFGQNYLMSATEGNHPVIFTMGDNDTFPLWYNQEVEEFRTDIRTCNAAYLQSEWYIGAMKRDYYDSPALPIPWEEKEYKAMDTEAIPVRPEMKQAIDKLYQDSPEEAAREFGENPYEVNNIMKYWVRSDNPRMKMIPSDSLVIKLDKEAIRRSGMKIPEALNGEIPDYMHISLKGRNYVYRSELMMLEIVAGCNWERPVYIAVSVGADGRFCFENNLCQEGLLCRITPFNTTALNSRMDSEKTYDYMVNKFQWGGIEDPDVYMDETARRLYTAGRLYFANLAELLIKEEKYEKALNTLERSRRAIPHESIPHDLQHGSLKMAESYYRLGKKEQGNEVMVALADKSVEYITWYLGMSKHLKYRAVHNCMYHFYLLKEEIKIMEKYEIDLLDVYWEKFERLYAQAEQDFINI